MMIKPTLIGLVLFVASCLQAQEWQTDLDDAVALADQENKTVVLVFQGSDWCTPCILLDKKIWSSQEFQSYSKDHFVMLKADFPRKKSNQLSEEQQEKNAILVERYNAQGFFPLIVILDKDRNVLGKTGYKKMTPTEYIEHLESFIKPE